MGLDMYLYKKTYVGNKYREVNQQVQVIMPTDQSKVTFPSNGIQQKRIESIVEEVGYWRKANQIHKWFVDNVQNGVDDCGEYAVQEEQLKDLLDACKKVKENKEVAETVLPTQSGFFFGGTEYDQWYMQEIDDTIQIIETLFSERREGKDYLDGDIYYSSSW